MVKTVSTYINERRNARRDWMREYEEFQGPPGSRVAVVSELERRDLLDEAVSLAGKKGWSLRKRCAVAKYFQKVVAGLSYRALDTMTLEMVDELLEQTAQGYDRLTDGRSEKPRSVMATATPTPMFTPTATSTPSPDPSGMPTPTVEAEGIPVTPRLRIVIANPVQQSFWPKDPQSPGG